jgi:glutathione S-transferase
MEKQDSAKAGTVNLYYWNIRGLAAYDQLALEAAGVPYEYHAYTEDKEDQWFKHDKPGMTMTLPNLPYLQDGALLVSEHDAIFRHILRKYKPEMLGSSIEEQAAVD